MKAFFLLREWARRIKGDVMAIYFAARDPGTPMHLRIMALAMAAYAISPIDLIPDFIPVLGYLDDLLLLPIGIWVLARLLPPEVLLQARIRAAAVTARPTSAAAAVVIVGIWALCAATIGYWMITG
ncbi:MAG: DUF1232 domain-containing protein [Steroidobacteraceae bacterium]